MWPSTIDTLLITCSCSLILRYRGPCARASMQCSPALPYEGKQHIYLDFGELIPMLQLTTTIKGPSRKCTRGKGLCRVTWIWVYLTLVLNQLADYPAFYQQDTTKMSHKHWFMLLAVLSVWRGL
eukprot:jgi/Botrbrau1/8368/Bobra.0046s0028.1